MDSVKNYIRAIYKTRFFWMHLAQWDLKFKFRRSKLGILWTVFQPFLLTIIMSFIFGFVFKTPVSSYAPYILSGILVWDVLNSSVIGNSYSFVAAEAYIRQFSHPFIIYPLRNSLVSIATFIIANISLGIWTLVTQPENLILAVFTLPLTTCLLFILSLSLSIISSHINTRYRDYPYVMALLLQMLWYISPVFFQTSMFMSSRFLRIFFTINPVTHLLSLVREPFLYGRLPPIGSYVYVLLIDIVCLIVAYFVNKKYEKTVIFYI